MTPKFGYINGTLHLKTARYCLFRKQALGLVVRILGHVSSLDVSRVWSESQKKLSTIGAVDKSLDAVLKILWGKPRTSSSLVTSTTLKYLISLEKIISLKSWTNQISNLRGTLLAHFNPILGSVFRLNLGIFLTRIFGFQSSQLEDLSGPESAKRQTSGLNLILAHNIPGGQWHGETV